MQIFPYLIYCSKNTNDLSPGFCIFTLIRSPSLWCILPESLNTGMWAPTARFALLLHMYLIEGHTEQHLIFQDILNCNKHLSHKPAFTVAHSVRAFQKTWESGSGRALMIYQLPDKFQLRGSQYVFSFNRACFNFWFSKWNSSSATCRKTSLANFTTLMISITTPDSILVQLSH